MVQDWRQGGAYGVAAAATAHHGRLRQHVGFEQLRARTRHQLRLGCIERQCVLRGQQAEVDAAGAGRERGARRQHGSPDHARGATDHEHVAERALVLRMRTRYRQRARRLGAAQARRGLGGRHAEVVEPHAAGVIATERGEQAGLQGQQRQGVRGAHRVAEHRAGIAVQTGRHVGGEHRRVSGVKPRDGIGPHARQLAAAADAEQRVEGEIGLHAFGQRGLNRHAGIASGLQRLSLRRSGRAWRRPAQSRARTSLVHAASAPR